MTAAASIQALRAIRWRTIFRFCFLLLALFYAWVAISLILLRWIDPVTTALQTQRRIESWFEKGDYRKRSEFVPLSRISISLQHAVVSAEDGRFYQHHGLDWAEMKDAIEDDLEGGRLRGASTITQQLVKNLYFGTGGSFVRKALELTLAPMADVILGKPRTLELYLNVVEFESGVFGAEAAARHHYRISAARLTRDQSARLAAILPSPRRRHPARMGRYSAIIRERMAQAGW